MFALSILECKQEFWLAIYMLSSSALCADTKNISSFQLNFQMGGWPTVYTESNTKNPLFGYTPYTRIYSIRKPILLRSNILLVLPSSRIDFTLSQYVKVKNVFIMFQL